MHLMHNSFTLNEKRECVFQDRGQGDEISLWGELRGETPQGLMENFLTFSVDGDIILTF